MINLDQLSKGLDNKVNYIEFLKDGKFLRKTFADISVDIKMVSSNLKAIGLKKGDIIAISLQDSHELIIIDIACVLNGIIPLVLDNSKDFDPASIKNEYKLKHLIVNKASENNDSFLIKMTDLFLSVSDTEKESFENSKFNDSDTFTIISTSTGNKLVEIKRSYFNEMVSNLLQSFPVLEDDKCLIFLPLHIYWGRINVYCAIIAGFNIVMSPVQYVFPTMKETKPTFFTGIPVFFEGIENNFKLKVNQKRFSRFYFSLYLLCKKLKLNFLFNNRFKHFTDIFGNNVKFAITGSAPIKPETIKFYNNMGIKLYEGYGMSEVGGSMICMNTPLHNRYGSVGKPFPGKEVLVSNDGEILVKSHNVPKEYFYNKVSNNDIFREDHIATGDIGYFDNDGFLFLKGRKDDVFILKSGLNINPLEFEKEISTLPYVSACTIFSQNKINLSVVIVIEETGINKEKVALDIQSLKGKSKLNFNLITNIILTNEKFTRENGLLSSNFKLNRENIIKKYNT